MWYFTCFVVVFVANSLALTDKEVQAEFTRRILKCSIEEPVPFSELMNLRKLIVPKDPKTKCLLRCVYKSMNTINDKGMYDLAEAKKNAELVAAGDADRLKRGLNVAEECEKVNNEPVTDGEKGCDRSAIMFGCFVASATKNGFDVPKSI